ncbi:MAG: hypothetical protein MHM6MM_004657 [Cercozoa sp. M6MM]
MAPPPTAPPVVGGVPITGATLACINLAVGTLLFLLRQQDKVVLFLTGGAGGAFATHCALRAAATSPTASPWLVQDNQTALFIVLVAGVLSGVLFCCFESIAKFCVGVIVGVVLGLSTSAAAAQIFGVHKTSLAVFTGLWTLGLVCACVALLWWLMRKVFRTVCIILAAYLIAAGAEFWLLQALNKGAGGSSTDVDGCLSVDAVIDALLVEQAPKGWACFAALALWILRSEKSSDIEMPGPGGGNKSELAKVDSTFKLRRARHVDELTHEEDDEFENRSHRNAYSLSGRRFFDFEYTNRDPAPATEQKKEQAESTSEKSRSRFSDFTPRALLIGIGSGTMAATSLTSIPLSAFMLLDDPQESSPSTIPKNKLRRQERSVIIN